MSFAIYLAGIVVLLAGLVYGAILLAVPAPWIVAGAMVTLGASVLVGVTVTRHKDAAA